MGYYGHSWNPDDSPIYFGVLNGAITLIGGWLLVVVERRCGIARPLRAGRADGLCGDLRRSGLADLGGTQRRRSTPRLRWGAGAATMLIAGGACLLLAYDARVSDDLFDLTGKVAVVTGGSRGSGERSCWRSRERGADVVIASRKLDACSELAARGAASEFGRARAPRRLSRRPLGGRGPAGCAVYEEFGRCDVLVNNAGMSPSVSVARPRSARSCSTRSCRSTSRARSGCAR